jgi:hypothetical protein
MINVDRHKPKIIEVVKTIIFFLILLNATRKNNSNANTKLKDNIICRVVTNDSMSLMYTPQIEPKRLYASRLYTIHDAPGG